MTAVVQRAAPTAGADPSRAITALFGVDVGAAVLRAEETRARVDEAADTLRAIAAGEVDGFVVSDQESGHHTFTLSTADRPYRMFVENMRDGAATLSATGFVLYANWRLAELLACARSDIVGSPLADFLASGEPFDLAALRGRDGNGAAFESLLVASAGQEVPVMVGSSPLDVDGDCLTCLTFTDLSVHHGQAREIARLREAQDQRVAELQEAEAALTRQATHDALTGLPNRTLLVDRIEQSLAQSTITGRSLAVLFVDLDGFKQVNDTQGHAAGDVVLCRVASQMIAALRPTDTVARTGGDEFVILVGDVRDDLHAVDLSDRLVQELSRGLDHDEHQDHITASVGVAVSAAGRGSAEVLLNEADTAMYKAKALGGGRAAIFDAVLGRAVQERAQARHMIETALDQDRVIAHYQPITDLASGRVAGFEALARIIDRDGAIRAPLSFIPVAEESGLIVPLGASVLRLACQEAARWRHGDGTRLSVAVNLAARQFQPGDLVQVVRDCLTETGLEPTYLHFELTETSILDLRPDVVAQLGGLRDLGVQIGLDDFGTGYASLTHLRRLPVNFIKIDQTFVHGLETDLEDERIVAALVDLASNLGLRSIAEGVETAGQRNRLHVLGCDQAQGYLFDRPGPPAEVAAAFRGEL